MRIRGGADLKALSRVIDKFCLKHRRFGIPRLMQYIVFITGAVYIIDQLPTAASFQMLLAFNPDLILHGQIWRLVSWVFLPLDSGIIFTVLLLYFYYFVGSTLEQVWGTAKFNIYYFFGVLLNIIYGFVLWFVRGRPVCNEIISYFFTFVWLTPSYLNLSMYFAFATLFPNYVVRLFFIIPVKIKWMALVNAGYFAFAIAYNAVSGNYSIAFIPLVALLNYILICGYDLLGNLRPALARPSHQAINFKRAARRASREYDGKPYRHKCAVCGRTDCSDPELEFRYCSRCEGYHCFCSEHINNHEHFR